MSVSSISTSSSSSLIDDGIAATSTDSAATTQTAEEIAYDKYVDELLAKWKEVADKYDVESLTPYKFMKAAKILAEAKGCTDKDARAVQRFARRMVDEKGFDAKKKYNWTKVLEEHSQELLKSRHKSERDIAERTQSVTDVLLKLKSYEPVDTKA